MIRSGLWPDFFMEQTKIITSITFGCYIRKLLSLDINGITTKIDKCE